jgi:hypothetical protein
MYRESRPRANFNLPRNLPAKVVTVHTPTHRKERDEWGTLGYLGWNAH